MRTWRWILAVAGRATWLVAALCVLQGAIAANSVVFALVMREAIDAAVAGASRAFGAAALTFGGLILLQVLMLAANRFAAERARAALDNRFRQRAFSCVLGRDYRTASSFHTGALVSRMTSDVTAVTEGAVGFVPSVVSMGIRVAGALAAMLALAPALAVVFLALGCAAALMSLALRGWLKRLHRGVQEAESDVRCLLQECLESLLVVRAFGCEGKVLRMSGRTMGEHGRARMRKANASNLCNTGLSLAMQGGYVLGFVWCGYGILQGTVSYGTLMAVVQLVGQIQSPFASLGGRFSQYSSMLASAERLMELEGEACGRGEGVAAATPDGRGCGDTAAGKPEERAGGGVAVEASERRREAVATLDGHAGGGKAAGVPDERADEGAAELYGRMAALRFDRVTFRYDRLPVLSDFSLAVRKGGFVAVTGPSGRGKSTLMKLLLAAYAPDSGEVCLELAGGMRLPASHLPAGLFAYVPQGNHLMSGIVRDVVGFAERGPRIDEARVEQACRIACAWEFVERLPGGLDAVLGERGAGLSEGQMQRLAVARAVYSQAPVLLLDEATSALDAETERRMLANLRGLAGHTVIVVTHRAAALELCDSVVEMGEGEHGEG